MLPRAFRHLAALLALLPALSGAQILVGQTAGFSGPVAAGVKETTEGARLWIDAVNAKGGVNGQKIELLSLDDQFDPKLAAANAKTLIVDKDVVAMFLSRGTPHTEAIRPLLDEHKLALVAPSTGAMVLHEPVNPHIFNVRAPYQREAERAVQHLSTIGMTRVAVLHVDDSFGKDAAAGAAKGFARARLEPVVVATFDRAKPDFGPAVDKIVAAEAQAVLFFGSGGAIADGLRLLRAKGSRAQVVTLSNNASAGFVKSLGDLAHGTIVTQVFPSEHSLSLTLVKDAVDLARAKGLPGVSPAMMEGFAAARVLVEAPRRAGARPTRDGVLRALNGMDNFDLGGMKLSFSPTEHTGLHYTELSLIGADGRFLR